MKLVSLILIVFIFSGCVSKQEFPSGWNKIGLERNLECPDIVGIYKNNGIIESNENGPLLSSYLKLNADNANLIKISQDKGIFNIKAFTDNKIINEKNFNNKSISCNKGFWIINNDENHNSGGVLGKEWNTFYLTKNEDGLIIKKENSAVGLFFLLPIIGHDTSWVLFKNN